MQKLITTKNLIILVSLFLLLTLLLVPVQGSSEQFTVSLYREIQDPQTKEFRFLAEVDSEINSNRVTANWQLPNGLDSIGKTNNSNLTLEPGKNKFYLDVIPESKVNGKIKITIQAFESERRYSSTQSGEIRTDKEFNVLPLTQGYRQMSSAINVRNFAIRILMLSSILFVLSVVTKKILLKRKPDKIASKSPNDSSILQELSRLKAEQEADIAKQKK